MYAKSGVWWIQPFADQPNTPIGTDSNWHSSTHLGYEYAALLVEPGYKPVSTLQTLPPPGAGVVQVANVEGVQTPPQAHKTIQFSGYEWDVRGASSERGGRVCSYERDNAWVDADGALHLRVAKEEDKWTCAEVSLRRSLGYGSYRFSVRETSPFEPAMVLSMFTWDATNPDHHREVDIEISRWGDPLSKNAQYVVQPYYLKTNVVRFSAPAGPLVHSLKWQPGTVTFETVQNSHGAKPGRVIAEHTFSSGVPVPGEEVIHLNMDLPPSLRYAQILTMVQDRESNIWIGSTAGLFRLDASGVFERDEIQAGPTGGVTAAFVDREGNLWTGSTKGLDQFRESVFTSFSQSEGLPSDSGGPVYADPEGRIWFAPSGGGLYRLEDGKFGEVRAGGLKRQIVYSIVGGKDGIWVGRQRGGLTHIRDRGGTFDSQTYTTSDGLAQNSVYAVYEARDGTVWAGTLNGGVSRFREGRFSTYTTSDGLGSNTITAILESANGTMWFGTARGISALSDGRWSSYGTSSGLPADEVYCLLEDSTGVLWIGTANGLAAIHSDQSGHVWVPSNIPYSLREAVLGFAVDRSGSMWISTTSHIVRVNRDRLLQGDLTDSDIREYSVVDGLRGEAGVKRDSSVISDSLGHIWFSTNRGLSFVDPDKHQVAPPAIVKIEQIFADGHTFSLAGAVSIPGPHHRVTLSYAGLSLSIPQRVRFKYMLENFDQKWSEPTNSREATYTNLDSGTYRFHVMASNSDGQWNSAESVAQFEIEPLVWQRWWFRLIVITAIALVALLFYRLRMLRLSRQLNLRFEERLGERTRIAQELHDTLLQGLISASMQLHVVADQIPGDSAAKPRLSHVLELMARVIEEGRNAVGGLRAHQNSSLDLGKAFSQVRQEFAGQGEAEFHVIVEGRPRPLNPLIQDEIYKIGREALTNAFRHSHASTIEVELEYAMDGLRILVRDCGKGFDPELVQSGPDGHWGLSGMRERAKRIGAELRVLTRPAAGTEVELTVPGRISYVPAALTGASKWFGKLIPGRKRTIEGHRSEQG